MFLLCHADVPLNGVKNAFTEEACPADLSSWAFSRGGFGLARRVEAFRFARKPRGLPQGVRALFCDRLRHRVLSASSRGSGVSPLVRDVAGNSPRSASQSGNVLPPLPTAVHLSLRC